MTSRIKTTTALVACLSIAAQTPVFAQGNGQGNAFGLAKQTARDLGLEMCSESDAPCVTEENLVLVDAPDLGLEVCSDAVEAPCLREDGLALLLPDDEQLDALVVAMADEPVESAPVTEGTQPAGADVAAGQSDAAPVAEAETVPAPDATSEARANTETAAETGNAEAAPEAAAEAEVEAEAEAGSEAEADLTETGEQIEEQTSAEVIAAPDENAEAGEQIAEQTTAEVIEAPEGETTAEAEAEAEPETVVEMQPPAAAAAAAAETDDIDVVAEGAEVETEEVTEETARSASEDFATSATVTAEAAAPASDGDSGLSNFEKAILLGLGAVAVGSILDNGSEVVSNSGDRVVLRGNDGNLQVLKDDDALLRQPGSQVRTERFDDGSSRTVVLREDGTRVVTIRAADGSVVRRSRVFEDGSQIVLFDDTQEVEPVVVSELPQPRPERATTFDATDEDALRLALSREMTVDVDRGFSLRQVRNIREVRELAPEIELDAITFRSGSAAIDPSQARELAALGRAMSRIVQERPWEIFLIEGHTDAVGDATYNLALSDRRAETVALALTEYFDVPPENMIVQGYGEQFLKIDTQADERQNRRAAIRRITPLLRSASAN